MAKKSMGKMNFSPDKFDFSPNIHLTNKKTIKAAKELLKYANVYTENTKTDLLDVLMTTLWICLQAKSASEKAGKKLTKRSLADILKPASKSKKFKAAAEADTSKASGNDGGEEQIDVVDAGNNQNNTAGAEGQAQTSQGNVSVNTSAAPNRPGPAYEEVFKDLLPDPQQEKDTEKSAGIQSANNEVMSLLSQPLSKRKRGPYIQYNSEERAKIGQWACEFGNSATVRLFASEFGKPLCESTVRSIKKQYQLECEKTSEEKVESLGKNCPGRPKLLGEFDKDVVEYLEKLQASGAIINRKIVIAGATGIIKNKAPHLLRENGGPIKLDENWAESLLRRIGFRRRSHEQKVANELPQDFEYMQHQFLSDVHGMIDNCQIPDPLVMNVHQTTINITPCGNWVAEPSGSKNVEFKKLEDKRGVTTMMTTTMAGELLPMQVLYLGKTDQCHAKVNFPPEWDIWHTEIQSSSEETLQRYAEKILIPYVHMMRIQLDLNRRHPALIVLDANHGPKSERFLQALAFADIQVRVVPWGCASKLEPLSISGSGQIKEEIKSQFVNWFANQVAKEMEGKVDGGFSSHELKMGSMKPIHAEWMVRAWHKVKDDFPVVFAGWLQSGIKRVENGYETYRV